MDALDTAPPAAEARHWLRSPLSVSLGYAACGAVALQGLGALQMEGLAPSGPAWGLLGVSTLALFALVRRLRVDRAGPDLDDLPDMLLQLDERGCLRSWNRPAALQADEERLTDGAHLSELAVAEDQPILHEALARAVKLGRAQCTARLRSGDGVALPCLWHLRPQTDDGGSMVGFLVSLGDMSDSDRRLRELEERERRHRQMVEMAPHLVAVVAQDRIVFINRAGARMLGAAGPAALLGGSWQSLRAGDQGLMRMDGTPIPVEITQVPTLYEGEVASLVQARDLTQVQVAEAARKDAELRLRGVVETAGDAIITADANGFIQSFNGGAEALFGYASFEVLGRSLSVLLPPEEAAHHETAMRRFLREGRERPTGPQREALALHKDGHTFPVEINLGCQRLDGEQLFTAVLRDVSERNKSATRLRVADKVLESTSEGVMVTEKSGTILWVNNAFCKISGYGRDEVIGKNASLLKSGMQNADFYKQMWKTIDDKGMWAGEIWNRRKDGEAYPEWLTIKAVPEPDGRISRYVGIFSDISKHKRAEETIKHLTYYDAVTRLPNRYLFQDRVGQALERARRTGKLVALVLVSLDRFKTVNETLGHQVGDALLREVAKRLSASVRGEDTVARMRGDTFCCVLTELTASHDATPVIHRIMDCFTHSYQLGEHELYVTASVGIGLYPVDGSELDDLLQKSETAMNRSKDAAESAFHFYTPEMNANSMERLRLETDLRKAIGREELALAYQPKVDTLSGRILGAEALLRWRHHEMGLVSPARFIPIAEETGLIVPIGGWALRHVCEQIRNWDQARVPTTRIAVNLSAHQFHQPDLVEMIVRVLEETGVPADMLELELTESAVMQNADTAIQTLMRLHEVGIRIAIDDFGTGYSSLSYLKKFPIDKLKIDRSFVQDLGTNSAGEEIVGAIIAMAHSLNLSVVAEGVETRQQLELLQCMDCDEIQGYYFSKPVFADEFETLLHTGVLGQEAA